MTSITIEPYHLQPLSQTLLGAFQSFEEETKRDHDTLHVTDSNSSNSNKRQLMATPDSPNKRRKGSISTEGKRYNREGIDSDDDGGEPQESRNAEYTDDQHEINQYLAQPSIMARKKLVTPFRSSSIQTPEEEQPEERKSTESADRNRVDGSEQNPLLCFPPLPVTLDAALAEFCRAHSNQRELERRRRRIRSFSQVDSDPDATRMCVGDDRLRKLRYYLITGITPSADQKNFFKFFIQACLPLIYGDEWNEHSPRVMKEHAIEVLMSQVLCMTPRRFGKTTAIAMFILALALALPGVTIAVFSPGSRASTSLMKLVEKLAKRIPGASERICGRNKERLCFAAKPLGVGVGLNSAAAKAAQNEPTTSILSFYPGGKTGQFQTNIVQLYDESDACMYTEWWWWWW